MAEGGEKSSRAIESKNKGSPIGDSLIKPKISPLTTGLRPPPAAAMGWRGGFGGLSPKYRAGPRRPPAVVCIARLSLFKAQLERFWAEWRISVLGYRGRPKG
jgi:hypothetical protein